VVSRRTFAALLAASGAALPAALVAQQTSQQTPQQTPQRPDPDALAPGQVRRRRVLPDTPAFEGPLTFTRRDVTPRVEAFPMSQVRLLPGNVFHDAQERNRGYMLKESRSGRIQSIPTSNTLRSP
jgi:hypothetical protein